MYDMGQGSYLVRTLSMNFEEMKGLPSYCYFVRKVYLEIQKENIKNKISVKVNVVLRFSYPICLSYNIQKEEDFLSSIVSPVCGLGIRR